MRPLLINTPLSQDVPQKQARPAAAAGSPPHKPSHPYQTRPALELPAAAPAGAATLAPTAPPGVQLDRSLGGGADAAGAAAADRQLPQQPQAADRPSDSEAGAQRAWLDGFVREALEHGEGGGADAAAESDDRPPFPLRPRSRRARQAALASTVPMTPMRNRVVIRHAQVLRLFMCQPRMNCNGSRI